jgi:hypothetical protein
MIDHADLMSIFQIITTNTMRKIIIVTFGAIFVGLGFFAEDIRLQSDASIGNTDNIVALRKADAGSLADDGQTCWAITEYCWFFDCYWATKCGDCDTHRVTELAAQGTCE